MKRITKLFSLLLAAALLVLVPEHNTLTAAAAGTTYVIGYNTEHGGGSWMWQLNRTSFDINEPDEPLDRLSDHIKDGDLLVIDASDAQDSLAVNVPVRLSNVTVTKATAHAVGITAKGIDEFYAIQKSSVGVHAPVKNAYIYDTNFVTFNDHVDNLEIISSGNYHKVINTSSTVGHVKSYTTAGHVYYEIWDVASGRFEDKNELLTPSEYYSTTPSARTTAAGAASAGTDLGEYDDVPKTGQESLPAVLLLGVSLLCLVSSRRLRRA